MATIITADSTCDLSRELIEKYGIIITPLYVNYDGNSYKDGLDIQPSQIFEYVSRTKTLPKTSATAVSDYIEVFSEITGRGDSIIHINISSEFSASYQNARTAANELEKLDDQIFVIDSRSLSTGSGHTVIKAAELAASGMEAAKIAEELKRFVLRVDASFCIDTLEYLHKGGRCSTVAMLGANILKLKPCIEVTEGKMTVGRKYRGAMKNVLTQYVKDRLENTKKIDNKRIFITHTGCADEIVQSVKTEIKKHYEFEEIIDTIAGCTISNHCGPGTLGILYVYAAD